MPNLELKTGSKHHFMPCLRLLLISDSSALTRDVGGYFTVQLCVRGAPL